MIEHFLSGAWDEVVEFVFGWLDVLPVEYMFWSFLSGTIVGAWFRWIAPISLLATWALSFVRSHKGGKRK